MNDLTDLHVALRDLERHAPDPAVIRARLDHDLSPSGRRRAPWLPMAASIGAVAATAVTIAVVSSSGGQRAPDRVAPGAPKHAPQSAATGAPAASAPSVGERVSATGRVLQAGGGWRVCLDPFTDPDRPNPTELTCGPVAVELRGMTAARLPAVLHDGSSGKELTGFLRVDGTWTGDAIAVDAVVRDANFDNIPVPPGEPDTSTVPCDAPAGGWKWDGKSTDGSTRKNAEMTVYNAVAARPDLYSSVWQATAPGFGQSQSAIENHQVMVVHTVGSVSQAHQQLSAGYPLPICVVHVERSFAQLAALAIRLTGSHPGWVAAPLPYSDRVWLRVPTTDSAAAAAASDTVVVTSLVQPAK